MVTIAMVVSNQHPPDPRVHKEALALDRAGHRVVVHAFDRQRSGVSEDVIDGIPVVRHGVGKVGYGARARTALGLHRWRRSVFRRLEAERPAAVHCHDADTLALGVEARAVWGAKAVFDMHDLHHTWVRIGRPYSPLRRLAARLLEGAMLRRARRADLIVTSSGARFASGHRGFREWLAARHLASVVVENRPEPPRAVPPLPDRFTVGYLGTVREPRTFSLLIEALRRMPPADRPAVHVAGGGTASTEVRRMFAAAEDVESTVTGEFTADRLSELMAGVSAMLCLYPTERGNILDGALPVKMFEAAAHGRPSIVNAGCLMADVARAESCGVAVLWDDPGLLAAAVERTRHLEVALPRRWWADEAAVLVEAVEALGRSR